MPWLDLGVCVEKRADGFGEERGSREDMLLDLGKPVALFKQEGKVEAERRSYGRMYL